MLNSIPSFGSWLRQRRKELGLTQPNLAQRVACSVETIDKIEAGKRRPSEQMAERLAECLDISPGEWQLFVEFARAQMPRHQFTSFTHFTNSTQPKSDFRAALQWALESGQLEAELQVSALWHFWYQHGNFREGREWLESFLSRAEINGKELAELPQARREQRSESEEDGQQPETAIRAEALLGLGTLAFGEGDFAAARAYLKESLAIYRRLEDKQGIADAFNNLGSVVTEQEDHGTARSLYEEGLAIRRELGNYADIACSLHNLGEIARCQGDYTAARSLYEESLAIRRELGHKNSVGMLLHNLGHVALHQGDFRQAAAFFAEGLQVATELGSKQGIVRCIAGLAGVAGANGTPLQAARLLGTAEAIREATGYVFDPADYAEYEHNLAATRAQLDEATWQAAWEEGQAMALSEQEMEQAIAYALEVGEPAAT